MISFLFLLAWIVCGLYASYLWYLEFGLHKIYGLRTSVFILALVLGPIAAFSWSIAYFSKEHK